jgi:hypothetical protein
LMAVWRDAVRRPRTTHFGWLTWSAVTASFVFAASAGTALASIGWQPATVLAPAPQDSPVDVAVDAKGDALAVWTAGLGALVFGSYRPAGSGGWSTPQQIGTSIYRTPPAVAFDGAGNATVAWVVDRGSGQTGLLASTRRGATGKWGQRRQVSPPGEGPVLSYLSPALGVDAGGDAVLAWTTGGTLSGFVDEVSYRPAGGTWQPPTKRGGYSLGLAVASDGSMLLTYLDSDAVDAATGFRGSWDAPVDLGHERGSSWPPAPAIAPGGSAAVVWTTEDPGFNGIAYAAVRAAGAWQPAQPISFVDGNAWPAPSVGIDARGNILAIFDTGLDVDATLKPAGGAWERPVVVSPRLFLPGSNLVMNAAGQVVAFWLWSQDIAGTGNTAFPLAAVEYVPGIGWGPAQTLDANTGGDASPVAAIDPGGDAIAVWEHNAPDGSAIESAILDAGGPLLHAVFNHARPRISGSARPRRNVHCTSGTWSGAPPISFRFRWLRDSHPVGSLQTYRGTRADAGSRLTCRVTATNALSSITVSSPPIRVRG